MQEAPSKLFSAQEAIPYECRYTRAFQLYHLPRCDDSWKLTRGQAKRCIPQRGQLNAYLARRNKEAICHFPQDRQGHTKPETEGKVEVQVQEFY